MSFNRAAARVSPLLLRSTARGIRLPSRGLPRELQAVAILIPHRGLATEQSTSTGNSGNYPPPGFNAEQAKKPLPKEQESKKESQNSAEAKDDSIEKIAIPRNSPTAHPKTAAEEKAALKEIAAEQAAEEKAEETKAAAIKKDDKKLTVWEKVKKEAAHYWDGTKLLVTEVKISSKLALKMAAGYELTRREARQLRRTVQDLGRLIPFSVFVIVPFAELLLPVALKLFPNLLPSTYEGQKAKDAKATSLRTTRKEVSNFLRQTLRETGLPVSAANVQSAEFAEFFRKVRATGDTPTTSDVIKTCKLFKDDLTLDNLSRPQLVAICRYMNMTAFGTDAFMRYQIRHRMRQIKRDDRAISFEGVDSLSVPELQMACASRGLRTYGLSPGRLREDLQMWLDLRLKYGVPSTLLVLSNAFMYAQGRDAEMGSQLDALQAVLSSIPEELYHEIELEVHSAEGAATNKQRLEVVKEQQEMIDEENAQSKSGETEGKSSPKDDQNIDEDDQQQQAKSAKEAESQGQGEEKEAKAVELDGEAKDAPEGQDNASAKEAEVNSTEASKQETKA